MVVSRLPLHYTPNEKFVYLRELTGIDELSVSETVSREAIRLVDRLILKEETSSTAPVRATDIATADRDHILASIYKQIYGPRIDSTILCLQCNQPMDLDFDLDNLIQYLWAGTNEYPVKNVGLGIFEMEDGSRFRLPAGNDEFAIEDLAADAAQKILIERCTVHNPDNVNRSAELETVMSQVAPIIETEMLTVCPECDESQSIHFDIQTYFLSSLIREKKQVSMEIHRLASAYRWSHHEIMNLPRSIRRMYLSHILSEMGLE